MNLRSFLINGAGKGGSPQPAPSWPATVEELVGLQESLDEATGEPWIPPERPLLVAGCFVCFSRGRAGAGHAGEAGWAAAALLRSGRLVSVGLARGVAGAAYEPGLLALREGLLLEEALEGLPERPDLLLVNATGRDHPRGAGLALHLGARLGLPSVGVTRNPLLAAGDLPAEPRGSLSPLFLAGSPVAYWVRTQRGKAALVAHAGWRTGAETAAELVLALTPRYRTPEPLRQARRLAREARSAEGSDGCVMAGSSFAQMREQTTRKRSSLRSCPMSPTSSMLLVCMANLPIGPRPEHAAGSGPVPGEGLAGGGIRR
ncbi:MAG: endonuclease V [Methylacidiphilaceae bacterium]|nr:endonuclease V [Candidatus Methylacidiphilaceae bacterium]